MSPLRVLSIITGIIYCAIPRAVQAQEGKDIASLYGRFAYPMLYIFNKLLVKNIYTCHKQKAV